MYLGEAPIAYNSEVKTDAIGGNWKAFVTGPDTKAAPTALSVLEPSV